MTSQKQIEANHRNALKSTGPVTAAGRAVVSQNAVKHGLRAQRIVIEGESQQEFNEFRNLLVDQLTPANPLETLLVDRVAAGFWRLRRAGEIEAEIFNEMRDSLLIDRNNSPDKSYLMTLDTDRTGFPSPLWFKTQKEAIAAWYATEAGWPDDPACPFSFESFGDFLEHTRKPEPEMPSTTTHDVTDYITELQNNSHDNYEFYSRLTELKHTLIKIADYPSSPLHIPAFRKYLQDLHQLFSQSGRCDEKSLRALEEGISDVSYYEATINEQLQPKLGQSVSHDLKGQNILTKFIRYESQVERSLFKAMHELERMQALRLGKETSVPVAIDVDIDVA